MKNSAFTTDRSSVVRGRPRPFAGKLGALGVGTTGGIAVDLAGAGGPELLHLGVNALAVGRDPCIAVNHGVILHRICATRKLKVIKGLDLVQKS